MDDDHIFSLEEIYKQLQAIGYDQMPKRDLDRFAKGNIEATYKLNHT